MKRLAAYATLAFALLLCFDAASRATTFEEFGRLDTNDEAGLVACLVDASAKMLTVRGHPEQAAKVVALFHDSSDAGGVHNLALNLRMLYTMNKRNATKANNSTPPYQVEDALVLTLKDAGVTVPANYLIKVADDFRPSDPPRQHINDP